MWRPRQATACGLARHDGNGLLREKYVWDSSGNERQITYDYDEFGRLTQKTYPDEGGYLTYEYTNKFFDNYGKVRKITDYRQPEDKIRDDQRPIDANSCFYFQYDYITGNTKEFSNDFGSVEYEYNYAYPDRKTHIIARENGNIAYDVNNYYDAAGRLINIQDNRAAAGYQNVASFNYDLRGNRTQLKHHLNGAADIGSPVLKLNYACNTENSLTGINTTSANTGGICPTYTFEAAHSGDIDGLGRLKNASETITVPGQGNRHWVNNYTYDMLSQLTGATVVTDGTPPITQTYGYSYKRDGNIETKTCDETPTSYEFNTDTENSSLFDSDLMTKAGPESLGWDRNNGHLATGLSGYKFDYNWDGKLRDVNDSLDNRLISLKYDAMGNRVYKESSAGTRKYIVDVASDIPVILCEFDTAADYRCSLKNSYFYADGQILKQQQYSYDGFTLTAVRPYFYICDRLGSVRLVVDCNGAVQNSYTYLPFGEDLNGECVEQVYNPFKYTGQWFDPEIGQYYLRARQYDPQLMRFTSRDPFRGNSSESLSLHKYLYCLNNPANGTDPLGLTNLPEEETVITEEGAGAGSGDAVAMSLKQEVQNFCTTVEYRNELMSELGSSFWEETLKGAEALEDFEEHHIVGQSAKNISRFGEQINNAFNRIPLPKGVHKEITRFMNRGRAYHEFMKNNGIGRTLGRYFAENGSFEQQQEWGIKMLDYLLTNDTLEGFVFTGF